MQSDIIKLADQLVSEFTNRLVIAGYPTVSVTREYDVTTDLGTFVDKRIEIYPLNYNPSDDATRTETYYDFRYSLVLMERYKQKGLIPKEWIDEQLLFCQNYVFNPLDNKQEDFFVTVDGNQHWPTDVKVTSVYDFDMLRQNKVFWSEIEVIFRKVSEGLGI